jgi:hypothetical protein
MRFGSSQTQSLFSLLSSVTNKRDSARPVRQSPELPSRFLSVLSVQSVVNFILAQGSQLFFLTEFLESGIGA